MPYIKPEYRAEFDRNIRLPALASSGELNYAITSLCAQYLEQGGTNYDRINAVVGALECAKLELYRRIAAPYEDVKLLENGDVYGG